SDTSNDVGRAFIDDRNTAGVVPPVFQPPEAVHQNARHVPGTDVSDDSAHCYLPFRRPQMISGVPANPRASETTSLARVVGSCLALASPLLRTGMATGITPFLRISSWSSEPPETICDPDFRYRCATPVPTADELRTHTSIGRTYSRSARTWSAAEKSS